MQDTTICVIGLGPRGLSVVERVCANAVADGTRVSLHVVDPHLREGGRVWHTGQPGVLLMNTVASQVTMFTDASVSCAGPVRVGPSLYEWASLIEPSESYPDWVHAEAAALGPDTYPTRAFYGHYLRWVFDHLTRYAAGVVEITAHATTATGLVDTGDTQQVTLADGEVLHCLDTVVLALGHLDVPVSGEERALRDFAAAHGLRYVPPGNPAEADLAALPPGEVVALRGLGLNFFDHMALLTTGRGGRFTEDGDGLRYEPSGREPVLVAGSRRGVPHHARGENQKGVHGRHFPLFLTPDAIRSLRARGRLGFTADVWPLVDREVRAVFYAAHVGGTAGGDPAAFLAAFLDSPDDPALPGRFGITARWDWDLIARPYGDRRFGDHDEYRTWLLDHLRADLVEARRGNVEGPLKAALDVMRDIRNEIRLVVDHGGLTGGSYRDELLSWYTPLNAFVSIGPPPRRIAEMAALVEAGVLRVCGPGMRVKPAPAGFVVGSEEIPGAEIVARTLVEARLPVTDIRATTDPLVRGLLERGSCTTYRMPDAESGDFVSGGLAVTGKPYRLIDAAGRAHPRRFAFGVPTEPVHWGTAAGIRPGVDSVILGDADAIARACLAVRAAVRLEKVDG